MQERSKFLETLYEYASESQLKILQEVVNQEGRVKRAGRVLGINESTIRGIIKRLSYMAAKCQNPITALTTNETPAGFSIERISKHMDKDGNMSGWVIANRDKENQFQAMQDAWSEYCETLPKAPLTESPIDTLENLLCDYTIGDNHTGLYAWAKEAGDDWDPERS